MAEGIIFQKFADNNEPYLYDDADIFEEYTEGGEVKHRLKKTPFKVTMGVDFGGNGSMTTFVLKLYFNRYHDLRTAEEDFIPLSTDIDADKICDTFVEFYRMCIEKYGRVDWVFPDSASTTMINSLRSAAKKAGLPYLNIKGCRKNEISDRPKTVDKLLNTGRLKINRRCENLRKAIEKLKWDEKKPNQPEDLNIGNCNDWWDAECYTWLDFVELVDLDR